MQKPHRKRTIVSCLECRRRKLRCNRLEPCNQCSRLNKNCVFAPPINDDKEPKKTRQTPPSLDSHIHPLQRSPPQPETTRIAPTPLAIFDASYSTGYNKNEEEYNRADTGFRYGRLGLTDRLGGFFRPLLAQEVKSTLVTLEQKLRENGRLVPVDLEASLKLRQEDFSFQSSKSILPMSLASLGTPTPALPGRLVADRLMLAFAHNVNHIARIAHMPTLYNIYENFWRQTNDGFSPSGPSAALVHASIFAGLVSLDSSDVLRDLGTAKDILYEEFKSRAEHALHHTDYMQTTKLEVLQALVVYLIPLCRSEISRAHSVIIGAAIRLAQCMGLHRDGTHLGLDPLETHVRRLIWYQLCFLDIRTCEAQGPQPSIRQEDFDTLLPLSMNDEAVHPVGPPPTSQDGHWTEMTFSLIRFECHEMQRKLFVARERLQRGIIDLNSIMRDIRSFEEYMARKYDHLIDERVPLQKCAALVKSFMMTRFYVMILHRYNGSVEKPMPERLQKTLLDMATLNQEIGVALDSDPDIASWEWYTGAYNQYQTTFLLITHLLIFPDDEHADRIWKCADFVFDTDPDTNREQKCWELMTTLQRKSAAYHMLRETKAPPVAMNWPYLGQGHDIQSLKAEAPGIEALGDIWADFDWDEWDRIFNRESADIEAFA